MPLVNMNCDIIGTKLGNRNLGGGPQPDCETLTGRDKDPISVMRGADSIIDWLQVAFI